MPTTKTFLQCAWFVTTLASGNVLSLNPDHHLTQYGHTAWRIQEGAFRGAVSSIAQTRDGYLWIGTGAGLVRFDGVRFDYSSKLQGKINTIVADNSGSLWIGLTGHLYRLRDGDMVDYPTTADVAAIAIDDLSRVRYALFHQPNADSRPLCSVDNQKSICLGKSEGVPFRNLTALQPDTNGSIWLSTTDQVAYWNNGSVQVFSPPALNGLATVNGISALARDPDGSLLVGISREGLGLGLQRLIGGTWTTVAMPGFDGNKIQVSKLLIDRERALWIGTEDTGVFRLSHGRAEHFDASNGLSGNEVTALIEDEEGNVWVGTTGGIDCFHDLSIVTYSFKEGLTGDHAQSVLAARNGDIWIGNKGALNVLRDDKMIAIDKPQGLPGDRVTALLEDHAGRLWVGVDNRLAIYSDARFKLIARPDGADLGTVIGLAEDTNNDVWANIISTSGKQELVHFSNDRFEEAVPLPYNAYRITADPGGGLLIAFRAGYWGRFQNNRLTTIPTPPGSGNPWDASPRDLHVTTSGLLFGHSRDGFFTWRNGRTKMLTEADGLPCTSGYATTLDRLGNIWSVGTCGLIEIPSGELEKVWDGQLHRINARLFDVLDGALVGYTYFTPSASTAPDGRVWFVNGTVAQMIDAEHTAFNKVPPPVHIESIIADHQSLKPEPNQRLATLTRQVEVDYTGLSYVLPQKVRFRYKLEGHDTEWQDAGARRQAFYNDLPPGSYTFRVIASNNSGVWNETGATSTFVIPPAWYQTLWFRVGIFIVLFAGLWAIYVTRLRQISASLRARYNERLDERTRMARDLHDTLLQTIQASKLEAERALAVSTDLAALRLSNERLIGWLGRAVDEGRAAVNALRYSRAGTSDLAAALRLAVDESLVNERMQCTFEISGVPKPMQPVVRDEVYQISYEAIRNASAHSGATQLTVRVEYAKDLVVSILDNGNGIEAGILEHGREDHHGLSGMRERASRIGATLDISSSPGSGTKVVLSVPGSLIF